MKKIPKILRNKFFLVTAFFIVWMIFFDRNNVFSQIRLRRQLSDIKSKVDFYKKKIDEAKQEKLDLFSDNEKLEKFARETYKMKKPDEDVFVIIRDSSAEKK